MRILQIQGLRALAAILVVVFHAHFLPGGFIGVDIFYVISGYLITGLILREIDSTGRLDVKAFYQRRIRRLLPTSVFVLFITALIAWLILPPINRSTLGRDFFAAATYMSNYLFAWWQNDYQNLGATPSPFIHYWSLAVEEQFYLLWPIFLIFLARKSKRVVFIGIAASTAASLILSIIFTQLTPIWAFYSLPTRAWELGFGALLVFLPTTAFKNRFMPWLAIAALIYSVLNFNENTPFPGKMALLPVLATAVLLATVRNWPPAFNALSNNRLSQWLGSISYPLYLWHWPALVLPSVALGRPLNFVERILCILLTVLLADLTSRYVEQPIRYSKINARATFTGAIAITIISALMGITISSTASSVITTSGATVQKFDFARVTAKPKVNDDKCHVTHGGSVSGPCTYGDLNSKVTIVLYGDSHAAQWFPALEKLAIKYSFKLISLTKSACPSTDSVRPDDGAFKMADCAKWRKNSLKRIAQIHPEAVIASSFQYFTPPAGYTDWDKWWDDGQRKLLAEVSKSTAHPIYIGDTPHPRENIPDCLSTRVAQSCDSTRKSPLRIVPGFEGIDPTPWLCAAICPAIIDGIVAYRDASHISVDMSLALVPKLEAALKSKGLFS